MASSDESRAQGLRDRLTAISNAWNAVPPAYNSVAQPTEDGIGPDANRPYATSPVVEAAMEIFLGSFADWALDAVTHFGRDAFPLDSAIPALPSAGCNLAELPWALTGTDDTVEAGRRLIYWAASFKDPAFCQRASTYDGLVVQWFEDALSQGILVFDFAGSLTLYSDPMDWVQQAFDHIQSQDDGTAGKDALASENIFRKVGDSWNMRYAGGDLFAMSDATGLFYIAYLLGRPNSPTPTRILRDAYASQQIDPCSRSYKGAREMASSQSEDGPSYVRDAGDVLDPQAMKQYRDRLDELKQERQTAQSMNDETQLSTIDKECGFIESELDRATGLGGQRKRVSAEEKKARDAVLKAINEILEKISEQDPDLERHLRNSIQMKDLLSYEPEKSVSWVI